MLNKNIEFSRRALVLLACCVLTSGAPAFAAVPADDRANPREVPVELLAMKIEHLQAAELKEEAESWLALLQQTVKELNQVRAEVWAENQVLKAAQEAGGQDASIIDGTADQAVEQEQQLKDQSLEQLAFLREQRVQVIDRLNIVVDELSQKLGTNEAGQEADEVLAYRRYIDSVKAVEVDTSDTRAVISAVENWLVSPEGGIRQAKNIAEFVLILAGFWFLSLLLGRLARKAMSLASGASVILSRFVVNTVRRVTVIVGILLGLSALEINVTPLVAVIGAAGFVIAFALQNTLSNFASGLMIMFYKPFDIGDFVQTSEVSGKVQSMTLVTTNMLTPDNKLMVVPNNELWGKVTTNVTGSSERRVDLVFGIGYSDDIAAAERVLREVIEAHPAVLKEPEPVIAVSELADSSVNFICRPWVKTADYWTTYWEVTRTVKERFDAEGISIPFPQRDVHIVKTD